MYSLWREKGKIYFQCHQFCFIILLFLPQNQCNVLTDAAEWWQDGRLYAMLVFTFQHWQSWLAYYLTLVSLSKLIPLRCNPSPVICHLLFILFPSPYYTASFPSSVLLDLSPPPPQLWCLSTLPTTSRLFARLTFCSFRNIFTLCRCLFPLNSQRTLSSCSQNFEYK